MKKPLKISSNRGSALLLVLGCTALLTILVLSFLVTTATERSTATFYSRGVSTSLLSEEVLNLVTAQIHQGTLSKDSTPAAAGATVAWASQPGMIRMYDSTGAASSYYKLFSSDVMVGSGAYTPGTTDTNDIPPTDWYKLSSVYTDLNSPINNVYPIVDNHNLVSGYTDPANITDSAAGTLQTYGSTSNPSVEGFSINPGTSFSSPTNSVAMPVQWIYVLQDGTLAAASWTDGVDKVTVPQANAANPIVGRIAFWTDDETSKVNINTASEGNFWDIPIADGAGERFFALNLPVKGEYNRIPGHPATVSMSSLFKDLYTPAYPTTPTAGLIFNPIANPTDLTPIQNILALTPRTLFGGSQFGMQPNPIVKESSTLPNYSPIGDAYNNASSIPSAPAAVDNKANRLYSSVDELLYSTAAPSPYRALNPPTSSVNPNPTLLTPAIIQRSRFFATATSRAPEVTLFNTPKISMWPITWPWSQGQAPGSAANIDKDMALTSNAYFTSTQPPMLQSTEKLLAYCGTIGKYAYYIQREDAYSTTNDWQFIQRNQDIFDYLQNLTGYPQPGFGGTYTDVSKYPADRDQILMEMIDYCRSGPNLNNNTTNTGTTTTRTNYNFAPGNNRLTTDYGSINGGLVAPLVPPQGTPGYGTKGAGRFASLKGVSLVFYAADRYKTSGPDGTGPFTSGPDVLSQKVDLTNTGTSTAFQRHFINFPGAWKVGWSGLANTTPPNAYLLTQAYGMQTTALGMYMAINVADMCPGYISDTVGLIVKIVPANNGSNFAPFEVGPVKTSNPTGNTWGPVSLDIFNTTSNDGNALFLNTNVNSGGYLGNSPVEAWMQFFGCTRVLGSEVAKSFTHGAYDPRRYPFFATPVPTDPGDIQFTLTAPDIELDIYTVDPTTIGTQKMTKGDLIQRIQVPLSQLDGVYPMPCAPSWEDRNTMNAAHYYIPPGGPTPATNPAPGLSGTLMVTQSGSLNYYHTTVTGSAAQTTIPLGSGGVIGFPTLELNGSNYPVNPAVSNGIRFFLSDQIASAATGTVGTLTDPVTNQSYSLNPLSNGTVQSGPNENGNLSTLQYADMRNVQYRAAQTTHSAGIWQGYPSGSGIPTWNTNTTDFGGYSGAMISQPVDTAISMIVDPINGVAGDLRIVALSTNVANTTGGWFVPHYGVAAMQNSMIPSGNNSIAAISMGSGDNIFNCGYWYFENRFGLVTPFASYTNSAFAWSGQPTKTISNMPSMPPLAPVKLADFANGAGNMPDGAIIPKPDDTNWTAGHDGDGSAQIPYFGGYNGEMDGNQPFFSPARQLSGPIAFGVLPTGVNAVGADIQAHPKLPSTNTWRTLAFEPNPSLPSLVATPPAVPGGHAGLQNPPDYLLLDDWWMPVVEPYAISEPLSTAGKINMNYQIVPFSHITRRTGLYAAIKSDVIPAITIQAASPSENSYKALSTSGTPNNWGFRYAIDVPHTLELLDYQSKMNNRLFISPSEICSVYLVPMRDPVLTYYRPGGTAVPAMTGTPANDLLTVQKYWQAYTGVGTPNLATGAATALTGVNGRQQPYAHIYSLLTTKSNTFQVHMRVQLLKKASNFPGNQVAVYDESTGDRVVGEYRGSATIERYVDATDTTLPDFTTAFTGPGSTTLDAYYKYRVTAVNAFTP